ncbi:MAG TPA: cupin domain-containing protein, partial [Methylotenera sp.]|nr:cupin domain-containing protein [Methylotenera sp.]
MAKITVEKPSPEKLASLGVTRWPIWTKEVSEFPWSYSSQEIAYILEGEV